MGDINRLLHDQMILGAGLNEYVSVMMVIQCGRIISGSSRRKGQLPLHKVTSLHSLQFS